MARFFRWLVGLFFPSKQEDPNEVALRNIRWPEELRNEVFYRTKKGV